MEILFPGLTSTSAVHPMLVHFPIALWVVALTLWVIAMVRGEDEFFRAGRWVLYAGSIGALAAVASGLWAANEMGHDSPGHDLVHTHRNFMLVATGVGLATTVLAFVLRKRANPSLRWGMVALLAITVGVTTLGADRGAELVHRYGIGTKGETPPAPPHDDGHGHHHPEEP
jgi:uncharacterized membrane protein